MPFSFISNPYHTMLLLCIMFSTQWKRFSILFFAFCFKEFFILMLLIFDILQTPLLTFILPFSTDLTVSGLGMVHVTIPNAIQSGRNAILTCEYELENDDLYSVKWYKGKELWGLPDGNGGRGTFLWRKNILSSNSLQARENSSAIHRRRFRQ